MKNETICNSTTLTAASFGYATKASKETMRGRNISNSNIKTIEIIDIFLPQKTYSEHKNQALIAFINGDLDLSLKLINDSQDKELKLLKARILFKKSQIQEADIIFNELAKKYPKFTELWHYQGMAFMLKGQTLEAITAWQKVMSLNKPYALFHKLDQRIAVAKSMIKTEQKIPMH